LQKYGGETIILGADCKDKMIATDGWIESSELELIDYIQGYEKEGVQYVICTDIAKDGMLQGPSIDLYKEVIRSTKVNLIASGGISNLQDLIELKNIGCEGAILGKAIYEGKVSLKELRELC